MWILTVVAVALLFGAGTAHAAPVWSGLDVRDYAGPIPPSGTLIAATPLDPAVSLPNAGRALRIHYSTSGRARQPRHQHRRGVPAGFTRHRRAATR